MKGNCDFPNYSKDHEKRISYVKITINGKKTNLKYPFKNLRWSFKKKNK